VTEARSALHRDLRAGSQSPADGELAAAAAAALAALTAGSSEATRAPRL
jgi:hypothetical protein